MYGPLRSLLIAACLTASLPAAAATVPDVIVLQGRLSMNNGDDIAGPVTLTASVYASPSADTPVYVEVIEPVSLLDGRFAVTYGADPIPGAPTLGEVLDLYPELWLGLTVDDGEEAPRQRLASTPFSMRAERAVVAETLALTCPAGSLLSHDGTGWTCAESVSAGQTGFPWAAGDAVGGAALDVACDGCVGGADLATGSVTSGHLQDGGIGAADVAFAWAAGTVAGGDAAGLACSGCVQSSDLASGLDLAGDTTVGGSLEACAAVPASGCFLSVGGGLTVGTDATVGGTLAVGTPTGDARVAIAGSSTSEDLLRAEAGGATRLRVRGDGFMAIGGVGPNAALDVTAGHQIQIQAGQPELILDDTQGGGRQYRVHSGRVAPGTFGVHDFQTGSDVLSIDPTGEVTVPGTLAVGNTMSFSAGQAFGFRAANLDAEPGTCTEALQGMIYFDVPTRSFMGCDGEAWISLGGAGAAVGTPTNPGVTCSTLRSDGVTSSGLYWIDPDGEGGAPAFEAYCDMVTEGMGWTLVGKINTADVYNQSEPHNWFASTMNLPLMAHPDMEKNAGLASLDADRFAAAITGEAVARFEVIAEDDYAQRAHWYKRVASADSFTSWFQTDPTPSLTCTDLQFTQNCSTSVVGVIGDVTYLQGMNLGHYGFSGCDLHLRLDGDGGPQYSSVCSCTGNNNGNAWHDDGLDGHWGNGLLVWLATGEAGTEGNALASCEAIHDAGTDTSGTYWIDPDGPGGNAAFEVWCEMEAHGGGWTLVAKINTADVYNQSEPHDWFAQTMNAGLMADDLMQKNAGLASHGAGRFTPLLDAGSVARFELIAEDDYAQRAYWFKQVASEASFTNWFQTDPTPSLTCSDLSMTQNCSTSIVGVISGVTNLQGMNLGHYGFSGCDLHLRMDGDSAPQYSSVCSCTGNNNGNAWHDDGLDGHWGNGLNVWLR